MSTAEATLRRTERSATAAAVAVDWRRRRGLRWGTVGRHLALIVLCLWVLLPLAWVIMLSIKSLPDGAHRWIIPKAWADPLWKHYQYISKRPRAVGPIWAVFKNSVLVTSLSVVSGTVLSVLGAYALTHLRTPGRHAILSILVASLFFPTQVTAITGIYAIQDKLNFIDVTWTLFFPYTALTTAISIFIMRGVFEGVPKELVDSARVDGASSFRTLVGIVLPLVRNGIVVVIIVNFVAAWGEYLLALTLMNSQDHRTLAVFLGTVGAGTGALLWPRMAALYIIAITPALITFGIAQRWYMKGLQEGALKT